MKQFVKNWIVRYNDLFSRIGKHPHTMRELSEIQIGVSKFTLVITSPLLVASILLSDGEPIAAYFLSYIILLPLLIGVANRVGSEIFENPVKQQESHMDKFAVEIFRKYDGMLEEVEEEEGDIGKTFRYKGSEITSIKFERGDSRMEDDLIFYDDKYIERYRVTRGDLDILRLIG